MKKIIKVVGGIIENFKGEILCTLRPEDKSLGNMWEFPGGKIEEDETYEKALKRELLEELNIEVKDVQFFSKTIKEYENFIVDLACYRCKIIDESQLKLLEHKAYVWLKKENLNSLVWVPTDIPVVDEIIENNQNIDRVVKYIKGYLEVCKFENRDRIVLKSGTIHNILNFDNAMLTVCNGMYKVRKYTDKILNQTPSGYSSTIEIEYFL